MKLKQFLKMKFMGDFITANMLEKVKKKVLFMGEVNKYLSIFDWIWLFCTCSFYGPLTIEMKGNFDNVSK